MYPKNILVTGANRGIGLEFVKQLLKFSPQNIIATARNPDQAKVRIFLSVHVAKSRIIIVKVQISGKMVYM